MKSKKLLGLLVLAGTSSSCITEPPVTWETIDAYDFIECLKIQKLPRTECFEKHEPIIHAYDPKGNYTKLSIEQAHKHIASSLEDNQKLRDFVYSIQKENARLKANCR